MWSMWDAPSDRDYYEQFNPYPPDEDDERCIDCGARWDKGEVCEPGCIYNQPAEEPSH